MAGINGYHILYYHPWRPSSAAAYDRYLKRGKWTVGRVGGGRVQPTSQLEPRVGQLGLSSE